MWGAAGVGWLLLIVVVACAGGGVNAAFSRLGQTRSAPTSTEAAPPPPWKLAPPPPSPEAARGGLRARVAVKPKRSNPDSADDDDGPRDALALPLPLVTAPGLYGQFGRCCVAPSQPSHTEANSYGSAAAIYSAVGSRPCTIVSLRKPEGLARIHLRPPRER